MNRHDESIQLLRRLRDWPKPQRPHSQLIVLLALHDAGEIGLRSGEISKTLGNELNAAGPIIAPLIKSGLVDVHESQLGRSTRYHTLTPLGVEHVRELLNPEPVPA